MLSTILTNTFKSARHFFDAHIPKEGRILFRIDPDHSFLQTEGVVVATHLVQQIPCAATCRVSWMPDTRPDAVRVCIR